ncbi:MAG: transcriptional repressor [Bacteroidaceae bacterium]|nr:transcriptional repressor [Bacteroidaceae bacterium]
MYSVENIKKAGLKLTPQRQAVYEAMMALRHARLEEIVAYMKGHHNAMTLSTVYRVLESFCSVGLLTLVCHPETGDCYYDITTKEHHHVFNGTNIVDLCDDELSEMVREYISAKRPEIKDIDRIQIQITMSPKDI